MQNAQKRDACKDQKFWFRKDITTDVSPPEANRCCAGTSCDPKECDLVGLMTANEIINGKVSVNSIVYKILYFDKMLLFSISFGSKKIIIWFDTYL